MIRNYLKIALRNLLRYKGYALINIASLAIGLAAFILIAAFVRQEWSYDRFHADADRIHRVIRLSEEDAAQGMVRVGGPWGPAVAADFPEVEDYARIIEFGRSLVRYEEETNWEENGILADSGFFQFFSFPLMEGRPEEVLQRPFTVVVSESFAQRYFGEENPIGKNLLVDGGDRYEVTGVMRDLPENSHLHFDFVASYDSHDAWFKREMQVNNYLLYLKLKPGIDPAAMEAKFPAWVDRRVNPDDDSDYLVDLQPLTDIHLRSNYQEEYEANGSWQTVLILSVLGLLILLIAGFNFTNLATARAGRRSQEIGVRKVVGARRSQLIGQFLSEAMVMALLAFLLATVLVEAALPYFNRLHGLMLDIEYLRDWPFTLFLIGIALLAGVLAGLYPAFYLSGFRPVRALKSDRLPAASGAWLRKGLVIAQFAASIVLIAGAGTIYRQLDYLLNKDLGFDREEVLALRMPDAEVTRKFEGLRERLEQQTGILGVSASSGSFGGGDWGMPLRYEGGDRPFSPRVMAVDDEYIPSYGMEIVKGRNFSEEMGTDETAFILNETAAKQLGWEDPIGKMMERPTGRNDAGEWEYRRGPVVGVVKDYHFRSLHQAIDPMVLFWEPSYISYYFIKLNPAQRSEMIAYLEEEWSSAAPAYPFDYFFLDESFAAMYRAESRLSSLVRAFALLAIFVACLGLFGLAAYEMERRTKEVGIRKVLGASSSGLMLRFSRQFLWLVGAAFLPAVPLTWYLMDRWLENFAYQIQVGAGVFLFAGGVALLTAWLAIAYHGWRAARRNPVEALRYE